MSAVHFVTSHLFLKFITTAYWISVKKNLHFVEIGTLECRIEEHARLFISRGFSTLLDVIWPARLLVFLKKFQPAHLFGPA